MCDSFCLVHFYIMLGWMMQTISAIFLYETAPIKKEKESCSCVDWGWGMIKGRGRS